MDHVHTVLEEALAFYIFRMRHRHFVCWMGSSVFPDNQLRSPTFPYIFQLRSTSIIFSESKADSLHKNIQIAAALATLLRLQFELFFHTSSCRVQKNPPEWRCFRGMDSSSSDSPCSCKWMSKNLIGSLSYDQRNKNPSDISASEAVRFLSTHSPLTTSFSSI